MRAAEVNAGRAIAGVVFLAAGIAFLLENVGIWTVDPILAWPLLLIAVGISVILGRARQRRVDESRSAQLAVAEERVRIARELHDIVAHGVSLMTIQIAAARRVAIKQPEAADGALAAAEQAGRQSLTELRSLLAVLRSADSSLGEARLGEVHQGGTAAIGVSAENEIDPAPTAPLPRLDEVPTLVETLRTAGVNVQLDDDRGRVSANEVAPATGLTIYRIVQEALTNAMRHAPGAAVRVRLERLPDSIRAVIDDDGLPNPASPRRPDGHGLIGMRERAAAVGGTVAAGPRPGGGWTVDAMIPSTPS